MQGFWLVGVLLGWALAFRVGLGIQGLWIGIASGDSTAGALGVPASTCACPGAYTYTYEAAL